MLSSSMTYVCFCCLVFAIPKSTAIQFTAPNGWLQDFSETFTVGDVLWIEWNAGWQEALGDQPDRVDLFITWWSSDAYSQRILEINVFATENATTTQPGTYPWTINVPRDTVAADCQFVFRFRPHRDPKDFSFDGPMSPSRGFNLRLSSISLSMSSVALVSTLKSTLTPTPTSKFASRSSSPVSRPSPKSKFSSNAVSNTTTLFSVTSASGSMSATTTILSSDEATPVASTSATPKTSQIPNSSNRNPKIGPIIGGVLGGVILVALCMVGLYFRHYMKRREISEIVVYKPKPRTPLVEAVAPPAPPRRRAEIDGRQIPVGASHGH